MVRTKAKASAAEKLKAAKRGKGRSGKEEATGVDDVPVAVNVGEDELCADEPAQQEPVAVTTAGFCKHFEDKWVVKRGEPGFVTSVPYCQLKSAGKIRSVSRAGVEDAKKWLREAGCWSVRCKIPVLVDVAAPDDKPQTTYPFVDGHHRHAAYGELIAEAFHEHEKELWQPTGLVEVYGVNSLAPREQMQKYCLLLNSQALGYTATTTTHMMRYLYEYKASVTAGNRAGDGGRQRKAPSWSDILSTAQVKLGTGTLNVRATITCMSSMTATKLATMESLLDDVDWEDVVVHLPPDVRSQFMAGLSHATVVPRSSAGGHGQPWSRSSHPWSAGTLADSSLLIGARNKGILQDEDQVCFALKYVFATWVFTQGRTLKTPSIKLALHYVAANPHVIQQAAQDHSVVRQLYPAEDDDPVTAGVIATMTPEQRTAMHNQYVILERLCYMPFIMEDHCADADDDDLPAVDQRPLLAKLVDEFVQQWFPDTALEAVMITGYESRQAVRDREAAVREAARQKQEELDVKAAMESLLGEVERLEAQRQLETGRWQVWFRAGGTTPWVWLDPTPGYVVHDLWNVDLSGGCPVMWHAGDINTVEKVFRELQTETYHIGLEVQMSTKPALGLGCFVVHQANKDDILATLPGRILTKISKDSHDLMEDTIQLDIEAAVPATPVLLPSQCAPAAYINSPVGQGVEANCEFVHRGYKVCIRATAAISPGSELWLDYGDSYSFTEPQLSRHMLQPDHMPDLCGPYPFLRAVRDRDEKYLLSRLACTLCKSNCCVNAPIWTAASSSAGRPGVCTSVYTI